MTNYLPYAETHMLSVAEQFSEWFGYLRLTGQVEEFIALLGNKVPAAAIGAGSGTSGSAPPGKTQDAANTTTVKELLTELSMIIVVAEARLESGDDLKELLNRIRQSVSFETEYFLKEKYSPEELRDLHSLE